MNRETGLRRVVLWGTALAIVAGIFLLFRIFTGGAGGDLTEIPGQDTAELTEYADGRQNENTSVENTAMPQEADDLTGTEEATSEEAATGAGQDSVPAFHEQGIRSLEEKRDFIKTHEILFPKELLGLLDRNEETVDFVYSYPALVRQGMDTVEAAMKETLSEEESESGHPLLIQWDNRWGAMPYGSSMMALSGCGPTCLAMVAVGMTGDSSITPASVGTFSMEEGYYTVGEGTSWDLITRGCEEYGLRARSIAKSEEEMIQNLDNGRMLICSVSPGDFTQTGHFIVIYGYEDGLFQINDPNSLVRSSMGWSYERLRGQLRNIWAMSVKRD